MVVIMEVTEADTAEVIIQVVFESIVNNAITVGESCPLPYRYNFSEKITK